MSLVDNSSFIKRRGVIEVISGLDGGGKVQNRRMRFRFICVYHSIKANKKVNIVNIKLKVMRPTDLQFRSVKQKTPDPYLTNISAFS